MDKERSVDGAVAAIKAAGIIAIIRGDFPVRQTAAIGETLTRASVSVIEVALNSPHALESIETLRSMLDDRALIGAGTVCSESDAQRAVSAGAHFAIAPNFDAATLTQAQKHGLLYIPGVLTPTEVVTAYNAGCKMLKLFPCDVLGPQYLRALQAPLNKVEFVPTGGVNAENIGSYFAAGAVAVAVGNALVAGPEQPLDEIAERAKALRAACRRPT